MSERDEVSDENNELSKEEVSNQVRTYVDIYDTIKLAQLEINTLKTLKKQMEEYIMDYMKKNDIQKLRYVHEVKGEIVLERVIRKSKTRLNNKYLKETINSYNKLNNSSINSEKILEEILSNRQIKENEKIKRISNRKDA
jgi:hypothetical protein